MLKRTSDVVLSLFFLFAVLPILVITALLIKIDSPGPVFFTQMRMGRGFRPFRLYKFRTMEIERRGSAITLGRDPRITPVGLWLRKLKIDELPQMLNVLRGEMSLVGPRPVILELAEEFRASYERLLVARPGLTDPATLLYANEVELLATVQEPMHYFRTILTPHKIKLSEEYLLRASMRSDFRLIVKTGQVLILSGAKSVEDGLKSLRRSEPIRLELHFQSGTHLSTITFATQEPSVLS